MDNQEDVYIDFASKTSFFEVSKILKDFLKIKI